MRPQVDEVYERHVVNGSLWEHEIRRILDVSRSQVCYEIIYPPDDGTTTASIPEPDVHQVGLKGWHLWAVLARRKENDVSLD